MNFDKAKNIYFIGIGGSSMSSLALIMKKRGHNVCGSDMQKSYTSDMLTEKGVTVYIGHSASNIDASSPSVVVMTDAIAQDNPELCRAKELGIPVCRRAQLLGYILDGYKKTVGVAGTHGKTTTSSLITSIFMEAGADPSAIIGGKMLNTGASYILGEGDPCVFESCEFKESYLYFRSDISVILNIAPDHMEYFKTMDNLIASFARYTGNVKDGGCLILNAEDENSMTMLERSGYSGKVVLFGIEKGDVTATDIKIEHGLSAFTVNLNGNPLFRVELKVPGYHNIKNALAATAAALEYGLPVDAIKAGMENFKGVGRRFEYHCTVNGAVIADDYGHHPDAYKVTFDTARSLGFKRIIGIHQPHTFSRTKMMMKEFVSVLSTVDKVLVPPIYPARETNDAYNIYAEDVVAALPNGEFLPDFESIAHRVKEIAQPGDIFITLGCGDINKAAILITKLYGEKKF